MSKEQIILVAIVSLMSFFWLFLLIGLKVYDFFMTKKARKMIKNGWQRCFTCEHKDDCYVRLDGGGCYGGKCYEQFTKIRRNNEERK